MASILLAGFDPELEVSLFRALRGQGHHVSTEQTATAALRAISETQPALVLLNTDLPEDSAASSLPDGYALCGAIRELPQGPNIMLAFISHRDEVPDKLSGFVAGADDYVTIPFQMPELLLRTTALLRRTCSDSQGELTASTWRRFGKVVYDRKTGEIWIHDRHDALTPVEVRLLDYLIDCAGRPVSAEELLRYVWRQDPGTGDPALVRVHVRNLRAKLERDPNDPQLIKTIARLGYYVPLEGSHESSV